MRQENTASSQEYTVYGSGAIHRAIRTKSVTLTYNKPGKCMSGILNTVDGKLLHVAAYAIPARGIPFDRNWQAEVSVTSRHFPSFD
jgi:hypothetical protein